MVVRGRHLYDTQESKVVLRGVNLPLLDDWDFPTTDKLSELVKTGANAVRIEWYMYDQPSRQPYTLENLDDFLNKCGQNQLIPILGLWDATSQTDINLLDAFIPWWKSNAGLLNKHQEYLIINLANELGSYKWSTKDPEDALIEFRDKYISAIISVREQLHMPIMVDAPDGGTRIDVWNRIGQTLIDQDPDHNLLLSVHSYWASYEGTCEIPTAVAANLPIVFGEIANKQDDPDAKDPI
jgi:mannan endo-1,4-beta-mannosidase